MSAQLGLSAGAGLGLKTSLSARQLQGIALLEKSLPALRAEIAARMAANPAIEDFDHPLETPLSEVEARREKDEAEPDYPEDDYTPVVNADEEVAERRQRFFDNQVGEETLQAHLIAQLPLSGIPRSDWPLVEVLVGDLDDDGFYRGSIPDACMAFGRKPEAVAALLGRVMELDPAGCGARTAQECLLAQVDKLDDSPYQDDVRRIIEGHLADVAANRYDTVMKALGLTREQYVAALKELRTLDPHPGRVFPGERDRVEYVNPEVHAVKDGGRWWALTDRRSLPEIKISGAFAANLKNRDLDEATRLYVRDKIAQAEALKESVAYRQDTLEQVAQAIFDRQPDFFEKGFAALKPLTETEIAEQLGLDKATVSRTVRDKYAATPQGTVELRRLFDLGVRTDGGAAFSQAAVLDRLKALVAAEDKAHPLSDQKLADALASGGFPVARRTVVKYRGLLGLPGAADRRVSG